MFIVVSKYSVLIREIGVLGYTVSGGTYTQTELVYFGNVSGLSDPYLSSLVYSKFKMIILDSRLGIEPLLK